MKKVLLIDAMALAFKAYYAFISRPLKNSKGEPTGAIYGFLTQLLKALEKEKPDYIAIAFDSKEKTFRSEIYKDYKANRLAFPEDLGPQLDKIKEIIDALNIKSIICPGYEADDIIFTIASSNFEDVIFLAFTADKDLIQIINDKIKIIKPSTKSDDPIIYDKQKTLEEFELNPEQFVDYIALVGDASDNIPGAKGIGEKTAIPLLKEFETIESIYNNIEKIKPPIAKKLLESKDAVFLSKQLAKIRNDVPIKFNLEDFAFQAPNYDRLSKIFAELEFKSLEDKIKKIFPNAREINRQESLFDEQRLYEAFDSKKSNYYLICDEKSARKLANELSEIEEFVFDVETDSLDKFNMNIAGVAFGFKENEACFVATSPTESELNLFSKNYPNRLPIKKFVEIFAPIFENENIKKICHNAKFDISALKNLGINVKNFYFDTMIAAYIIDPDQKQNLNDLSKKYLNYSPITFESLFDKKQEYSEIFEIDLEKLKDYACEDAEVEYKLYKCLKEVIIKNNQTKTAFELEFPLIEVLEDMERTGVQISLKELEEIGVELQKQIEIETAKIYELAGEVFNINSNQQLQKILYEKLKLEKGKKTKTGYSTDAKALENLLGTHPIVESILNYRQLFKLKSTYVDSLKNLVNPKTGRLHTTFNQNLVSTGRLSSSNPNLQNIPIRTEMGKEIRRAFVARNSECAIMSADYSQIELRILAHYSEDPNLVESFLSGKDIHAATASKIFKVNISEVTPEMRRKAKEVNFGIIYGLGPFGLKTRLGISQTEAKQIIDSYFQNFSKVKDFIEETLKLTREKGYSETIFGNRRYFKNINSANANLKSLDERAAINMPIQGSAANLIKKAMIDIYREFNQRNLKSKMVLQVHDELVFEVLKNELKEVQEIVKSKMENAIKFKVPIVVDIGIGNNWLEAH